MYTLQDVKRVQDRLLVMAKTIKSILEKENIPYFITYGTLLGAVRHQGFIPWDDDFDFYLFDDSYDSAMEVLQKELPDDMFLENAESEPLFFHGWGRVKDKNSIVTFDLFPQDSVYAHKGLTIDLFRTVLIPENREKLYRAKQHLEYIKRRYSHGLFTETEYQKKECLILKEIEKEKESSATPSNKKIYAFCINYDDRLYPEELFPLRQYRFEDTEFLGPNKPEALLTRCYGDFMQLPPMEKRKPHYSSVEFLDK